MKSQLMMNAYIASLAASREITPWYNNAWFIGIATGLASGAIIGLITPLFLSRRRARDLAIRKERAADDTLSTLRPAVASGALPSSPIVEAVARASAFRRGLDPKLATPTVGLMDQLISEVMISPFLAPDPRLKLANMLLSLRKDLEVIEPIGESEEPSQGSYKLTTVTTSVIGAVAFGAAAAVSSYLKSWVPFAVVGFLAFAAILFSQAGNRITRMRFGGASIEFASVQPTINIRSYGDGMTFHTDGEKILGSAQGGADAEDRPTEDDANGGSSESAQTPTRNGSPPMSSS